MQKPHKRISIEEYLRLEESSEIKHEYVDGEVFAMTRPTLRHQHILANILTLLKIQLKGSGCKTYSDSLARVEATNSLYSPDVLVDCGSSFDGSTLYTRLPTIIFEVLSPSTVAIDKREKLVAYKRIPSLKAYVIVQQSRKHVSVYRRVDRDEWTLAEFDKEGDFVIDACPGRNVDLDLDEIYEDAGLDDTPDFVVREGEEAYSWADY